MYIDQNVLTLTVSHNIFLTKEQRYLFAEPDAEIEAMGVSVPVWYLNGKTSEPAIEVFCKYKLKIDDGKKAVAKFDEGYNIFLPPFLDNSNLPIGIMIRDSKDGGKESLQYKEYSRIKKKTINYSVIHIIEIYDDQRLISTII